MSTLRCPECKSKDVLGSTREILTSNGTIFSIPCWFCDDCYHEEPVGSADVQEWLRGYYASIPVESRPKPRSMHPIKRNNPSGFFDEP